MRRTGQSVCGHPHAAAVFSKRSRNASGSSCGPIFCTGMWVGGAGTVGFSPARTSRSIQLWNSSRSSRWFWTRAQNLLSWSALMSISALCCSWWSPASDWMTSANGDPDGEDMMAAAFRLPSPGFGNQCNKVRRKEGSGQGWLVKTQVCLFKTDKLTQVRTLRHPETSTLSFVSAITLCIRSDCFSLTARALESSLRLSLNCRSTAAFIRSPRQLLQSDTGDPHFALDPLTYRCLLSLSPAADFAEPRPPRHIEDLTLILRTVLFFNNISVILCNMLKTTQNSKLIIALMKFLMFLWIDFHRKCIPTLKVVISLIPYVKT